MREFLKVALVGGAFVAAASLLSGATGELFADGRNTVLVEEVYTVRPGDTLWDIAEEYCAEEHGHAAVHPRIQGGDGGAESVADGAKEGDLPGDKIKVTYWVKEEQK